MEDRDRPEVLLAQPRGQLFADRDRPVVAAGTADPDGQASLAFGDVGRDRELEELVDEVNEANGDGLAEDERADLVGQTGQRRRSAT